MKRCLTITLLALGMLGLCITEVSQASSRYYGSYLCGYSEFKCVKVKRSDTWEKLFPNSHDRELVMKLNRTNMPLKYRSWIVIPTDLRDASLMQLSPFPKERDTNGKKTIVVSLSKHAFGAYDTDGKLVHWGPISGGKGYCADTGSACKTATGQFKIYRKQGEECKSSKFPVETQGGAPMPYCMHFYGGYALHGSTLPGYHASHGCVRMFPEDAKWVNQEFAPIGTTVIVSQ